METALQIGRAGVLLIAGTFLVTTFSMNRNPYSFHWEGDNPNFALISFLVAVGIFGGTVLLGISFILSTNALISSYN